MGISGKNMVQSPRYAASSARPGSVPGRVLGLQEILAALGTGDALAAKYRRQLYSLLY